MPQLSNSLQVVDLMFTGRPVGIKVAAQRLPALVVGLVEPLTCLQTPLGHSHTEGRLKHESLREGQDVPNGKQVPPEYLPTDL